MRFVLTDVAPASVACDLLVLPMAEGGSLLAGDAAEVDRALGGHLHEMAQSDGFTGKRGRTAMLHTPGATFRRVLLVGVGSDTTPESVRRFAATAVRRANEIHAGRIALALGGWSASNGSPAGERVQAAVEGAGLADYRFDRYRKREDEAQASEVQLVVRGDDRPGLDGAVRMAEVAIHATNRARDLVNEPPNVMTPKALADVAREIAATSGLDATVLGLDDARTMGMGLFAAVAAGSAEPPQFIVLEYRPRSGAREGARTVALVGKGITFDSGGLSIKAATGMATMKSDMAGAAAVLGTMGALRALEVPVRVLGIAAATENMISGAATRPGDIVRGLGGKTVEINNTDAEGRLVLADALAYAVRAGATEIIDLATLTGSCVVALGEHTAGLMSNDQALADRLLRAADLAGEQLWRLPIYDEFLEEMRGEISDLKNSGGRSAGAELAAAFLREFVGETPWAHLDIAGPAFSEGKQAAPYISPGGTGYGVRMLLRYLVSPVGA
jgi:leucyl aminopeptidase